MPVASRKHQHEDMYCSEQINIPLTFPSILKSFAKAAIRTQPYDLLSWTAAYFRAMANGELPPVKERLEYPPYVHPTGITPRFLKILINQYCHDEDSGITDVGPRTMNVRLESILRRWRGMALKDASLYQILMTGRLLQLSGTPRVCDLYRFLAVACGLLGNNLYETMIYICELVTKEPEGGSAMIPFRVFMSLYEYLADLDCTDGQSIIEMGQVKTQYEKEEKESPARSSRSSLTSASAASSSSSTFASCSKSESMENRTARCRSFDNSSDDTENSIYTIEVPCNVDDESESGDKVSCEQFQPLDTGRTSETENARVTLRRNDSGNRETGFCPRAEKMRKPQVAGKATVESRSQNTYGVKGKRLEAEVPEGEVERVGCGSDDAGTEVTRVQEERSRRHRHPRRRRRRRDDETHSREEKATAESVVEGTVAHQPCLDSPRTDPPSSSSSASPPRPGTSSSSFGKSHVVVEKDVKAGKTTPREKHPGSESRQTDKILETRSSKLDGKLDETHSAHPVATADRIENIRDDAEDSIKQRNVNVGRSNVRRMRKKKRDVSSGIRENKSKKDADKIVRDSIENDEELTNDEDELARTKKGFSSRQSNDDKTGKIGDKEVPLNFENEELAMSDDEEGCEDDEFEDMAMYEPIGLENILDGTCECLDDTRIIEGPSTSGLPGIESSTATPIDLVEEFLEKMRSTECSKDGSYILKDLPGIGPPVSKETVTAVGIWLSECSRRQEGQVGPRNLKHFMCPDLEGKSRDSNYDKKDCGCPNSEESIADSNTE